MLFYVNMISISGDKESEFLEAQDYDSLLDFLNAREFIPTSIIKIPVFFSFIKPQGTSKIKSQDVIELIDNLHLVIKSGLPLYQGLRDLASDTENKQFRKMLLQIAFDVNRGKSLSQAIERYKDVVGIMLLNLIKIGEETGQLELTLKRGSEFLKNTTSLKKKAKSALIYPSFAFFAVFSAMLVWMIYVLPQMTELFQQMNLKLPPLTLFVIALSGFLSNYIWYMLGLLIILIVIYKLAHKKYLQVRYYTDKLMLKIPVISQIISSFNTAFITEYIRLAIVSGVPLLSSLDTLKRNINNELYKEALENATDSVKQGSQLSEAFKKTQMFTPFVLRMMSVGENSGTLETQLEIISKFYYEKVDYYASNIGKVIEPLVLIIVGGFMALVISALMGPMYDLISNIQ